GNVPDRTVGFIHDERRTIRPSLQGIPRVVGQCPVAVDRLLDDDRSTAHLAETRFLYEAFPEPPERIEVFEVLVAVDGDLKLSGSLMLEDGCQIDQPSPVTIGDAAQFELEVAQAVRPDRRLEILRKAVVDSIVRRQLSH